LFGNNTNFYDIDNKNDIARGVQTLEDDPVTVVSSGRARFWAGRRRKPGRNESIVFEQHGSACRTAALHADRGEA
jgi:hypothetical protein